MKLTLTRSMTCLAIAAALLGACTADKTTPKASPGTPSASPSATPTPKASAQTSVLYSMHDMKRSDESNDIGTYRRRVPGGQAEKVNLKAAGRRYKSSPSGRFLSYTDGAIWVARAEDTSTFRKIADPADPILSLCWAPDGSRLFYSVGPLDESIKDPKERFFSIRFDGSDRREFAVFPSRAATAYQFRDLLGYDSGTDEVIWNFGIADGAGGSYELHATSVSTEKSRSLGVARDTVAYHASVLSADAKRYYYVKRERELVERTIAGGTEQTVYKAADSEKAIEFLHISENGSYLFFQGTAVPTNRFEPETGTTSTYRLEVATGNVDLAHSQTTGEQDTRRIGAVSPDGRHLWLSTAHLGDGAILLDFASGTSLDIKPGRDGADVRFIAWLTVGTV